MRTEKELILKQLVAAQDEYIALLSEELSTVMIFAAIHNWQSTRYEQGVLAREKIQKLKDEL